MTYLSLNKKSSIFIIVLFLLSPLVTMTLDPYSYSGGRSRDITASAERNSSAVATMLGEFRTSLNDIMFIKTERYLHSGVGYKMHHEKELFSVSARVDKSVEHTAETIIRTHQKDFRGLIGDLERSIKPWRDPSKGHTHTDGSELLPWYRIMTLNDKHNVRAYHLGSFWLMHQDIEEALKFIKEGLEYNPDAFQIYMMLGRVYSKKGMIMVEENSEEQSSEAEDCFLKARDAYIKATELALHQRPPLGADDPANTGWTSYMEEDARGSARFVVMIERRYGSPEEAERLAKIYSEKLGGDKILDRIAEQE